MRLETDALDSFGNFDPRYTCDIDNSSPELRWADAPEGTAGYAFLMEDIDATSGRVFSHWVVYNIPGNISHLPAGIPPQDSLPNGIRQGLNGFGKLGYAGPCPPKGHRPHRYVFRLFALSEIPVTSPRMTSEQLLALVHTFVIGTAELVGKYQRSAQAA
jgi:Raf kinase inhibitor-like YbhB/YbcL family protein